MDKIHKVETDGGFPVIIWSQPKYSRTRRYRTMYYRAADGFYFYEGRDFEPRKEIRPHFIAELAKLDWSRTRNCLACAPWLSPRSKSFPA